MFICKGNPLFETVARQKGYELVCISYSPPPQGTRSLFPDSKLNIQFTKFIKRTNADVVTPLKTQMSSDKAHEFKHTSMHYTLLGKCATREGFTAIASRRNNGRTLHDVIVPIEDDIKVGAVKRGPDHGFDEQWKGRILAVYTKGICFLGACMSQHTDARDLRRNQMRPSEKRRNHAIVLVTDIVVLVSATQFPASSPTNWHHRGRTVLRSRIYYQGLFCRRI